MASNVVSLAHANSRDMGASDLAVFKAALAVVERETYIFRQDRVGEEHWRDIP
jgi:hypothetical protein